MSIIAVQHIRRMRGGSQAHMMRCSDGHFYVVKFRNNPQHIRVLANEMFATRLAERVGLPVPVTEVVEVGSWLIQHTPELHIQLQHKVIPCEPGLQFGSRYVVSPVEGQVFDYMPVEMLGRVRNLETFAGILVFDKWTGNADGRQAAFWRKMSEKKYTTAFIDQGNCFNAAEWSFPDNPLHGVYAGNEVYANVSGWNSFEPWLSMIEQGIAETLIWKIAKAIPPQWHDAGQNVFDELVSTLLVRRQLVRRLVETFRFSTRRPFPSWLSAA